MGCDIVESYVCNIDLVNFWLAGCNGVSFTLELLGRVCSVVF